MIKKIPWKTILLILLVIIALYYNIKDYYLEILQVLDDLSILSILILIIYTTFYYIIQAINIWMLTTINNKSYTLKQAIQNNFITLFINNVFFITTGKIAQLYLFNKQGVDPKEAPSIVFIEFINYQITLLIYYSVVFLLSIRFYFNNFSYETYLAILGLIVTLVITLANIFIVALPKSQTIIKNCLTRIAKILPIKLNIEKIDTSLAEMIRYFNNGKDYLFKHKKRWLLIILNNVLRISLLLVLPYIISKFLNLAITLNDLTTFISLYVFVNLALSSFPIPGKHGVSESFFVIAFSCIMWEYEAATLMIIWRLLTYYTNTIIGAIMVIFNKDIKLGELKDKRAASKIEKAVTK